ncbi:hypothetical protein OA342_00435 [Pelagibacteraceae bacterium]|nr:hypothetical protein [Pelagibacteraceae bacterium]
MKQSIRNFVQVGNFIADEARKISLKYFKKKLKVRSKDLKNFDPVTIADISIQKKINKIISISFPMHSVLGEEGSIETNSDYEWCIDPIDGTKSFIQGFPAWGTLISLSKKGKIILGIADIPALDERYIGYSNISYKVIKGKRSKLKTRKTFNLNESILNTTSPYVFENKYDQKIFERIVNKVKMVRLGGDCYSYCLLADGHVDIVIESGLKPWDIRALEPIIKNAGGELKTWKGNKIYNGGRIIASANDQLFKKVKSFLIKKKPRHK